MVRAAIWMPSRAAQSAIRTATTISRGGKSCGGSISAAPIPTRPSPKVQAVSTQPELPVRSRISQAPDMMTDSATAMAAIEENEQSECHDGTVRSSRASF